MRRLTPLLALLAVPLCAQRPFSTGTAAPNPTCTAARVNTYYLQTGDPATVTTALWSCAQTGASSYGWVLVSGAVGPVSAVNGNLAGFDGTTGKLLKDSGSKAADFAVAAKGVTNGDTHDHSGGDGAAIPLSSGVTGTLPLGGGGTGQTTWTAGRCVQVASGGTTLESAATACGAGGGGSGNMTITTGLYSALPGTCTVGESYYLATDTAEFYGCSATDTWALLISSPATGAGSIEFPTSGAMSVGSVGAVKIGATTGDSLAISKGGAAIKTIATTDQLTTNPVTAGAVIGAGGMVVGDDGARGVKISTLNGGVLKIATGVPALVTGTATDCVLVNGSSGACGSTSDLYTVVTDATTSRTLTTGDCASVIQFTSSSAVTVTVPTGLGAGCNVIVSQSGTGVVSFSASGTTLRQLAGTAATAGQHAKVFLYATTDSLWELTGQLAVTLAVASGGTGTASTLTGLVRGSASAMTAAELSGDATTSASNAVTVGKINGATVIRPLACGVGDPAGDALVTGVLCYIVAPNACTITSWDILVDAGTVTLGVWKIATGTAIPTVSNSIVASAPPTLTTGTAKHSTTMTSWTTSVAQFDILAFNLTSIDSGTPKYIYGGVNCAQ